MEFLPYPHLIATLFNGCAFGPPLPFTATSTWTWIDHPVSGLHMLTQRPVKTWFPFGSAPEALNLASIRNSPDRSTKSTRSYPCGTSTACKHRVSGSLSLPSRGPFHLSLTVLILYRSPGSVQPWGVVPPPSLRVSRVPSYSGSRRPPSDFAYGDFTLFVRPSQIVRLSFGITFAVLYPGVLALRFGLLRFRSPLLSVSLLFSFPPAT